MTEQQYLNGNFLIALPGLEGDFFANSITLLIEHNQDGAFGLIINKPADVTLPQIIDHTPEPPDLPVLIGGPVHQDQLYFLHSTDKVYPNSYIINDDVSLTTSTDLLNDPTAPEHTLVLVGYAGWASTQLEQELVRDAWLVASFNRDIVFSTPFKNRPQAAAQKMGLDLNLINANSGHH